jgi:ABC-2 type transport system permease protein
MEAEMKTFPLFFKNFLVCTFQNKSAYILHFILPIAGFAGMYLLLRAGESEAFAGTQAIGLVVFYTMIQAAMIVSLTLRDLEQGILKRIMVSPAAPYAYVAGNGAAALLIMSIQVLVFVGFINFIFPVRTGLGFFQLLPILLVFNVTSIGFGFLVCALSDTSSGAMLIASITVMFSSLMGGSFFPVDFMSDFMQKLAFAFPQYWVMKAIRQTQSGSPFAESGLSLAILLLFGLLFVLIQSALKRGKKGLV